MSAHSTKRIRVLVTDDSTAVKRLLAHALNAQTDLEVAVCAENRATTLDRIALDRPDVVLLDLEAPGADGLDILREIKRRHADLPVLAFSAQAPHMGKSAAEALLAGADEHVTKPVSMTPGSSSWNASQGELALKLRSVTRRSRRRQFDRSVESVGESVKPGGRGNPPVRAIVIGTSSGGPEALGILLPRLPASLKVPLFIVQHMPRSFTTALAGRLNEKSHLRVSEAAHGQVVEPGVAYLAAGDYHLQISNRLGKVALMLDEGPLENGCRPSVDPLFRSAAEVYGNGLLAVVLTGMGSDGVEGTRKVADAGGHVWVQDQQSSAIWGMPGAVVRAGLARRTLGLDAMAEAIVSALAQGLPLQQASEAKGR